MTSSNKQMQVLPVILCGGSGTRLWPLSRSGFPKQFLCLTGSDSLFQQAAQRLLGLASPGIEIAQPIIVTGEEHRFLAAEQLREAGIPLGAALLEPVGRNTAPALTLAALAAMHNGQDPVLAVTPADQTVANPIAFTKAMHRAIAEAEHGSIVILGVTPTHPETGYGYIQASLRGEAEANHAVQNFVEKPNKVTAEQYLAQGNYFWNAGMFVLKASVWLKALEQFRPSILHATQQAWAARTIDVNTSAPFIRPGIQAGAMGQGGDVFVLDMGEPVKIIDLARRMVELSGLTVRDEANPSGDIELAVTGLRPGEKLYEELLIGDNPQATQHPRIMKAHEQFVAWPELQVCLNALSLAVSANDVPAIRGLLQQLVSGYQPTGEVVDWVHLAQEREALAGSV